MRGVMWAVFIIHTRALLSSPPPLLSSSTALARPPSSSPPPSASLSVSASSPRTARHWARRVCAGTPEHAELSRASSPEAGEGRGGEGRGEEWSGGEGRGGEGRGGEGRGGEGRGGRDGGRREKEIREQKEYDATPTGRVLQLAKSSVITSLLSSKYQTVLRN